MLVKIWGRAIRAKRKILRGEILKKDLVEVLRPCPSDAIAPYDLEKVLNKKIIEDIDTGECIMWKKIK